MNALRSEWKLIISTIKAHGQFKNYNLARMVGILKTHETKVMGEVKPISNVGPLAFIANEENTK